MTKRCKNCGWPNDDSSMTCQKCGSPLDGAMAAPTAPIRFANNNPGGGDNGESLRRTVSEKQFFATSDDDPGDYQVTQRTQKASMKQCPNCHYQVREGMNNCPNCGASLSGQGGPTVDNGKKCPKCGRQNPVGSRFCSQCGTDLDAPAQAPVQAPAQAPAQAPNNPIMAAPMPGVGNAGGARGGTVNPWMKPSNGAYCTLKPVAWDGENVQHQTLSFSGQSIMLNRANTDPNNQSITSAEQAELTFEDGEWYIIDKSAMHTTYVMAGRKLKLQKGDTIILGNRLFEFN